ncbi:hypothetical protein OPQ81_012009, partial [Rhizoctonia solani]
EARDEYKDFEIPSSSLPKNPEPHPEAAKEPATMMNDTALPNGAEAIDSPPKAMNNTSHNSHNPLPTAPLERSGSVTPTCAQGLSKETTPIGHHFQPEFYNAKAHPWHNGNRNKDPSNAFLCNFLGHIELDLNCIIQYLHNRFYKDKTVSEHTNAIGFIKAFCDFHDNTLDKLHKLHHEATTYLDENANCMSTTNQDVNLHYPCDESPKAQDEEVIPLSQNDQDKGMEIDPIAQETENLKRHIPKIINPTPIMPTPPKLNDPTINFLIKQVMNQN